MPQVLVKVAPDAFYYALVTNASRRPQIRAACADASGILIACSSEFHRRNPKMVPHERRVWQARIDEFHDKVCHIRLATDGNDKRGGFVVLDGELLGFHNVDCGRGDWMMRWAVALGANRLDCFDIPHLIDLYERHGFREILREPNTTKGQPDVVWMRRD